MNEIVNKVKLAFKENGKWQFLSERAGEKRVELKFYCGRNETDVQIFRINGITQNIGFNYARKTRTLNAIIEVLTK